jgi:ketosteroid isomerase-like protein
MPSVTSNRPWIAASWLWRQRLGLTVSGQSASRKAVGIGVPHDAPVRGPDHWVGERADQAPPRVVEVLGVVEREPQADGRVRFGDLPRDGRWRVGGLRASRVGCATYWRAMSQENLEIARQMIACVNRGDDEGLAALVADDVAYFPYGDSPLHGREQVLQYVRSWTEAFDRYAYESSQYVEVGDCVVISGRTVARGRGSGVELTSDDAWVIRFRDGEAIECREYETRRDALDAVRYKSHSTDADSHD